MYISQFDASGVLSLEVSAFSEEMNNLGATTPRSGFVDEVSLVPRLISNIRPHVSFFKKAQMYRNYRKCAGIVLIQRTPI